MGAFPFLLGITRHSISINFADEKRNAFERETTTDKNDDSAAILAYLR